MPKRKRGEGLADSKTKRRTKKTAEKRNSRKYVYIPNERA